MTAVSARNRTMLGAVLLAGLLVGQVAATDAAAGDIRRGAVDRAQRFMDTAKRGKFIMSYLHFGSTYDDHEATKIVRVTDPSGRTAEGHFALIYHFGWDGDGYTNVAFFFDEDGDFYEIKALNHNAIVNQPFLKADVSIAILGNLILEMLKDQMTGEQLREARRFINNGNSKGLLELGLKTQQGLGL